MWLISHDIVYKTKNAMWIVSHEDNPLNINDIQGDPKKRQKNKNFITWVVTGFFR